MKEDEYELTKRRLVDDVRDTVRKQLFATYALIGGAVLAVLGYTGWDIVTDIRKNGEEAVAQIKKEGNTAVADIQEDTQHQVDKIKDDLKRALEAELDTLTREVFKQAGLIAGESKRIGMMLSAVSTELGKLDVDASTLAKINETVSVLSEARRDTQKQLIDVAARMDSLTVLEAELKRLAGALEQVQPGSAAVAAEVVKNVAEAQAEAKARTERPTVYLQFAGGARSKAQELSRRLASDGFIMPGEERIATAAGKHEVRYFHDADQEAAKRLAEATRGALVDMGLDDKNILVEDFSEAKTKTSAGTIELWIEL